MALKIKVKVTQVLETEYWGDKNTPKKEFIGEIVEGNEKYRKVIAFPLWGEKNVEKCPQVGAVVNVSFDIASREWKGKWYTEIRVFDIDVVEGVLLSPEAGNTPKACVSQSKP